MKKTKTVLSLFLMMLFAVPGNAALKDRLEPVLTGEVNVSVDTFIIGTHDKYVATIVRDLDQETVEDFTLGMREMVNLHDNSKIILIEKQIFDKNSKRFSLAERDLALKADLEARLVSEPMIGSDMQETKPGSLEEYIWNKVAGPGGLGATILGEYPGPVKVDEKSKRPVETNRYIPLLRKEIGGTFLDRNSIQKTDEGCSALVVESFNFDEEFNYGGMMANYAYQPYVDAYYAVMEYEYSFKEVAHRQLRLTIFSRDDKVIYSIRNVGDMWITENADALLPYAILAVRRNLPEDVATSLSDDVKSFDAYVQKKIAEAAKAREESQGQEESRDTETAK